MVSNIFLSYWIGLKKHLAKKDKLRSKTKKNKLVAVNQQTSLPSSKNYYSLLLIFVLTMLES
jgi:hypothetical protein